MIYLCHNMYEKQMSQTWEMGTYDDYVSHVEILILDSGKKNQFIFLIYFPVLYLCRRPNHHIEGI